MCNIEGLEISISRGDSVTLIFSFGGQTPADGTQAVMTVKRGTDRDTPAKWSKTATISAGKAQFDITNADTNIKSGVYHWDLILHYADGEKYSPFRFPHLLEIVEVIGDVA